jgi:hypothetical protein
MSLAQRIEQAQSATLMWPSPTSLPVEENYKQLSPCGKTLCVQPSCVAFYCPEPPSTRCSTCHQKIADNYGNLPGTY